MTTKDLLEIGRRIHHQSSGIPRERLRIAVTQHEWDAMKEYMESNRLITTNDEPVVKLGICGVELVIV